MRSAPQRQNQWAGFDQGLALFAEHLAAIVWCAGVGYALDHLLGTRPILFVVGAVFGNGFGVFLIYRRSKDEKSERTASRDGSSVGEFVER